MDGRQQSRIQPRNGDIIVSFSVQILVPLYLPEATEQRQRSFFCSVTVKNALLIPKRDGFEMRCSSLTGVSCQYLCRTLYRSYYLFVSSGPKVSCGAVLDSDDPRCVV